MSTVVNTGIAATGYEYNEDLPFPVKLLFIAADAVLFIIAMVFLTGSKLDSKSSFPGVPMSFDQSKSRKTITETPVIFLDSSPITNAAAMYELLEGKEEEVSMPEKRKQFEISVKSSVPQTKHVGSINPFNFASPSSSTLVTSSTPSQLKFLNSTQTQQQPIAAQLPINAMSTQRADSNETLRFKLSALEAKATKKGGSRRRRRYAWDEVEMRRRGLLSRDCERAPVKPNEDSGTPSLIDVSIYEDNGVRSMLTTDGRIIPASAPSTPQTNDRSANVEKNGRLKTKHSSIRGQQPRKKGKKIDVEVDSPPPAKLSQSSKSGSDFSTTSLKSAPKNSIKLNQEKSVSRKKGKIAPPSATPTNSSASVSTAASHNASATTIASRRLDRFKHYSPVQKKDVSLMSHHLADALKMACKKSPDSGEVTASSASTLSTALTLSNISTVRSSPPSLPISPLETSVISYRSDVSSPRIVRPQPRSGPTTLSASIAAETKSAKRSDVSTAASISSKSNLVTATLNPDVVRASVMPTAGGFVPNVSTANTPYNAASPTAIPSTRAIAASIGVNTPFPTSNAISAQSVVNVGPTGNANLDSSKSESTDKELKSTNNANVLRKN